MLFLAMLIYAFHSSLEDREEVFAAIHVDSLVFSRNILASSVAHNLMICKFTFQILVLSSFVGHHPSFFINILFQNRHKGLCIYAVYNEAL